MANPPREATADVREAAAHVRALFNALMQEGFTEAQTLIIIGHVMSAGIKPN